MPQKLCITKFSQFWDGLQMLDPNDDAIKSSILFGFVAQIIFNLRLLLPQRHSNYNLSLRKTCSFEATILLRTFRSLNSRQGDTAFSAI